MLKSLSTDRKWHQLQGLEINTKRMTTRITEPHANRLSVSLTEERIHKKEKTHNTETQLRKNWYRT
jgi:hypothetical protein